MSLRETGLYVEATWFLLAIPVFAYCAIASIEMISSSARERWLARIGATTRHRRIGVYLILGAIAAPFWFAFVFMCLLLGADRIVGLVISGFTALHYSRACRGKPRAIPWLVGAAFCLAYIAANCIIFQGISSGPYSEAARLESRAIPWLVGAVFSVVYVAACIILKEILSGPVVDGF
jgi:hypothetical protein